MGFDNRLGNRQSQAGAAGWEAAGLIGTVASVKDPRECRGGRGFPGVGNRQDGFLLFALQGDADRAAFFVLA